MTPKVNKKIISILKRLSLIRSQKPHPISLHALPEELVELVALFLEDIDLCSLRLTCKVLNYKTSTVFWRASLRSIQTDLSLASLKKLEMLSRNPQLSGHVEELTFKGFDENRIILGEVFEWNRHPSGHLVNLHKEHAVKLLQPIICQLVNCKSFECLVYDSRSPRSCRNR